MSDPSGGFEERKWLGRVRSTDAPREIVGACFAVDPRHLLTCAHVVHDAGAAGPGDRVWVDFPLLEGRGAWATVIEDGWRPVPGEGDEASAADVALLRLADDAPDADVLPLRTRCSYDGLAFAAYGFPAGHAASDAAHGTLGLRVGLEWLRVDAPLNPGWTSAASTAATRRTCALRSTRPRDGSRCSRSSSRSCRPA